MNSSASSGFTNFADIFYLWKCCCNLSVYSTYIGYVNVCNTLYNLSKMDWITEVIITSNTHGNCYIVLISLAINQMILYTMWRFGD